MNMRKAMTLAMTMWLGTGAAAVWAQGESAGQGMDSMDMESMDHNAMEGEASSTMPGMDQGTMQSQDAGHDMHHGDGSTGMEGMDHGAMPSQDTDHHMGHGENASMPGMDHGAMSGMDHSGMSGMDHGSAATMTDTGMADMNHGAMQGGAAPADARDPHAYSDGYTLESGPYVLPGPRQLRLGDEHNFGSLLVDRLEAVHTADDTATAYDVQAWFGRDYDRVVLKAEGDYAKGQFEEASTELLWSHAVTAYWDAQVGLRYDGGEGPKRSWLAFGVQGLAPYWFEVDATAYVGDEGRSAVSVHAEYEVLLTQRWILQPRLEADFYGKEDAERGMGSGLAEARAGLRLRYEIRREFAPYVGLERVGKFGGSADFARAAGTDTKQTRAVAGVRFWF
jgi:copper resistance protein B